jgi:hypothetical protein
MCWTHGNGQYAVFFQWTWKHLHRASTHITCYNNRCSFALYTCFLPSYATHNTRHTHLTQHPAMVKPLPFHMITCCQYTCASNAIMCLSHACALLVFLLSFNRSRKQITISASMCMQIEQRTTCTTSSTLNVAVTHDTFTHDSFADDSLSDDRFADDRFAKDSFPI